MTRVCLLVLVWAAAALGASILDDDVLEQGLYSKDDRVIILTRYNFDRKVYGQRNALLVQFYNSYCGHCRAFSPKFKTLAQDLQSWHSFLQLAVMDCSVEVNNEVCRQFEVMGYPSLRYFHENYVKGNSNLGDNILLAETSQQVKNSLIAKMRTEQALGRLQSAPTMAISAYATYAGAMADVPDDVSYIFLVFENDNSTLGSELAFDINDYEGIKVKRVYEISELALTAGVRQTPALVAIENQGRSIVATPLTPETVTKENMLKSINSFLRSKNYVFPRRDFTIDRLDENKVQDDVPTNRDADIVYYSDLEKTIKTSLSTEITRYKVMSGEVLQALFNYLDVLISSFPSRGNFKEYIIDLRNTLSTRNEWNGAEVYDLVKALESKHAPVYSTNLEYIGCRGSQPRYRGYTCGLWTLFHTLTVNAADQPGLEGPKVLQALHGYVKHFFGCTECAEHFQAMAARNRLFEVKENDKAVLWLWISHNEVNLRLAGDTTEDPMHPKIQFPSATRCGTCRLARGAWDLPAVYEYLRRVYGAAGIRETRRARSSASPFSNLDIGMLSLLLFLGAWVGRGGLSRYMG